MRFPKLLALTVAFALCAAAASPTDAGVVRQGVHARLAAQIADDDAVGHFRLNHRVRDNDVVIDRLEVDAAGLDASAEHRVFLVSSDGTLTGDFGALLLTRRGRGGMRFTTRLDTLPEGVTDVTVFGGGTIEVRQGDTVVLSAAIPSFVGTDDDTDGGAGAVRRDTNRLRPTDTSTGVRAHGAIFARYANVPRGVNEQIRVQVVGLGRDGAPYTCVAIAGDATETTLCELVPRRRFGADVEHVDTREGDVIPGPGSVRDLSEQTVEVRDVNGAVVLTGTFPRVAN